jgi:preprotein translocase subunit SecG
MVILITTIHVIVCLFLIIVVLLQSGKAADLAGAFGGMGSQTVFGPRGSATVLSKATTVAATLFMVTSLILSISATKAGSGMPALLEKATKPAAQQKQVPGAPAAGKAPQTPGSFPIQVTPSVDGVKGPTQTVPAPVQTVPAGQAPTLPATPAAPPPAGKK